MLLVVVSCCPWWCSNGKSESDEDRAIEGGNRNVGAGDCDIGLVIGVRIGVRTEEVDAASCNTTTTTMALTTTNATSHTTWSSIMMGSSGMASSIGGSSSYSGGDCGSGCCCWWW